MLYTEFGFLIFKKNVPRVADIRILHGHTLGVTHLTDMVLRHCLVKNNIFRHDCVPYTKRMYYIFVGLTNLENKVDLYFVV